MPIPHRTSRLPRVAIVQRPIFLAAAPRSGADLLGEALSAAPGILTLGEGLSAVFEGVPGLSPAGREWQDNRLTQADVLPELIDGVKANLEPAIPPQAEGTDPPRLLDALPKAALRIPFLASIFPDATFVFVYREPRPTLAEMLRGWDSGRFVTYPDLPGWDGPPWSFPLVPGWQDLRGRPPAEVVVEQWMRITATLLGDLQALPGDRWGVADETALTEQPERELSRISEFLQISWDGRMAGAVERLREQVDASRPPDLGGQAAELERLLPKTDELARKARAWVAVPLASQQASDPGASPLRSVYTGSMPQLLRQMGSSILVSTYQTGKLIALREQNGTLNTHFRGFDKPMGMAQAPGRLILGSRLEVWDYRNMPEAAQKVEPPGSHDACFLPRNRHYTGDIAVHEMGFAGGELWLVATSFSCLATLDSDHSFVPRWAPPFISELAPEDRCHLNGMCVVDDAVKYVTALGTTNEGGGWRETKATGGVLMDVPSGEVVAPNLSMPHSPRWHDGKLWVLESGKGEIGTVDLDTGEVEVVCQLPGFTRGLSFYGNHAFVGLSQIRETATFGGLPLAERVKDRLCGVWAVNLGTGEISGFLRFQDLVQEIFAVEILAGIRYPEIAEERSELTSRSFLLPP